VASLDKFCKSVKVKPIGGRLLVPPNPKPPLPRPRPPRPPLPPPPRDIPTTRGAWAEEDFFEVNAEGDQQSPESECDGFESPTAT
jgi:hypothetical protein